jgi:hypothetical protein
MKRLIKKITAVVITAVLGAGAVACDPEVLADIKLPGVWTVEKLVEGTTTTLPADGDGDMWTSMVISPDGTIVITNKDLDVYSGSWEYEDEKFIIGTEGDLEIEFDVKELTLQTFVFGMGDELVYHFKKELGTEDK